MPGGLFVHKAAPGNPVAKTSPARDQWLKCTSAGGFRTQLCSGAMVWFQ